MRTIQLTSALTDNQTNRLRGELLDARHYTRRIRHSAVVRKPNGRPLLVYERHGIPPDVTARMLNACLGSDLNPISGLRSRIYADPERHHRHVPSAAMGFLDRASGQPCRLTTFSHHEPEVFRAVVPLLRVVNHRYRELAPDYWAAQREFIEGVPDDFVLRDSVFTTFTVNRSWQTPAHVDDGDFRGGLGVMTVLEDGEYDGCELIFPKYRVAVDMRTGGVLLADVHEVHGNAPFNTLRGDRFSFVFYARERMNECGSLEEERQFAAERESW
jgi:hypothetical protein